MTYSSIWIFSTSLYSYSELNIRHGPTMKSGCRLSRGRAFWIVAYSRMRPMIPRWWSAWRWETNIVLKFRKNSRYSEGGRCRFKYAKEPSPQSNMIFPTPGIFKTVHDTYVSLEN